MDSRNAYKSKNPFVVPEHYFEEFPDRVMQRVARKERTLLKRCRSYMNWAAVFVVGVVGVWMAITMGERDRNQGKEQAYVPANLDEPIFDSQFNPTCDEIIEYLVTEVDDYEMLLAGNY